jgi:hypothetical protein
MASKTIEEIDNEISIYQTAIQRLSAEKATKLTLRQDALRQRPTGIPMTWLPVYDDRGGTASVTAWFDPDKYGTNFIPLTRI